MKNKTQLQSKYPRNQYAQLVETNVVVIDFWEFRNYLVCDKEETDNNYIEFLNETAYQLDLAAPDPYLSFGEVVGSSYYTDNYAYMCKFTSDVETLINSLIWETYTSISNVLFKFDL